MINGLSKRFLINFQLIVAAPDSFLQFTGLTMYQLGFTVRYFRVTIRQNNRLVTNKQLQNFSLISTKCGSVKAKACFYFS